MLCRVVNFSHFSFSDGGRIVVDHHHHLVHRVRGQEKVQGFKSHRRISLLTSVRHDLLAAPHAIEWLFTPTPPPTRSFCQILEKLSILLIIRSLVLGRLFLLLIFVGQPIEKPKLCWHEMLDFGERLKVTTLDQHFGAKKWVFFAKVCRKFLTFSPFFSFSPWKS